jgi:hypothetical protein
LSDLGRSQETIAIGQVKPLKEPWVAGVLVNDSRFTEDYEIERLRRDYQDMARVKNTNSHRLIVNRNPAAL